MTVTVERVTDGFDEPPVDATAGLTLDNVQRNRRIILGATVADDQSGIKQVRLDGETHWDCITPGDEFGEHMHGNDLVRGHRRFRSNTNPAALVKPEREISSLV
jgi:hypothetical protein